MQQKLVKKADIILAAVLLIVGAALLIWRLLPSDGVTAVIYCGGSEIQRIDLTKTEQLTVTPDSDPEVVIKVDNGAIYFERADCPDKLCVKAGKLTRPGETAACLPAGVVIRLEGSERKHDAITGRVGL